MTIYISGQISGTDDYEDRFAAAHNRLVTQGHKIINPVAWLKDVAEKLTYDEMMGLCLRMVEAADAIYMLEGFEESKGACRELDRALELHRRVIFEPDMPREGTVHKHSLAEL